MVRASLIRFMEEVLGELIGMIWDIALVSTVTIVFQLTKPYQEWVPFKISFSLGPNIIFFKAKIRKKRQPLAGQILDMNTYKDNMTQY